MRVAHGCDDDTGRVDAKPPSMAAAALACLRCSAESRCSLHRRADAVKAKEIGKTDKTPKPSCPTPSGNDFPARRGCQVLGEVTGVPALRRRQGRAHARSPTTGTSSAGRWTSPSPATASGSSSRGCWATVPSTARPRPASRCSPRPRRKSGCAPRAPPSTSSSSLGRRQYYTLNNPIEVKKGWHRGPHHADLGPDFAHDLRNDDLWRASRDQGRCEGEKNLTQRSHPHLNPGSVKTYGCTYSDARVLYWAYFKKA